MSHSPELQTALENYPNLKQDMHRTIQGALEEGYGENEGEAFEAEDLLDLAVSTNYHQAEHSILLCVAKHVVREYGFNIA